MLPDTTLIFGSRAADAPPLFSPPLLPSPLMPRRDVDAIYVDALRVIPDN